MLDCRDEYASYSPADLEAMNPLYAAYVAASGMRVPKGRNDLFAAWLMRRRDEFQADRDARMKKLEFEEWLVGRHAALQVA